jgi:hypothetical protein
MCLFCQSINQSTTNQITLSQLTHKSKSIHKWTNQSINQMNEWKQGCLFLWSALFVCFVWFVVCLFVWFKVGSLLILFINQSHQSINQMKSTKPIQLSFLLHTLFSINQCQSSVNFFFHSFFPSLISIQSINQKRSIDRQQTRREIDEWMNEWIEINLTDKSIHVQLITESQFDLVWLSISFSNQLTN